MPENSTSITIRPATPSDAPLLVSLIEALADYERLRHVCAADVATLSRHLFGERPYAEAIVAHWNGNAGCAAGGVAGGIAAGTAGSVAAGFALFFHTFSTFNCAPTLYLEDLFVLPEHRRKGLGLAMLQHLAGLAVERGCRRFEWSVLDWNRPALEFYEKCGARVLDDWRICRLDGTALQAIARTK